MGMLGRQFVAILGRERGAILWLPGLAFTAWVVLVAGGLTPGGTTLFTHTTSVRVALGPWTSDGDDRNAAAREVAAAIRQRFEAHGDVSLVDAARAARRPAAASVVPGDDSERLLRAIRPLNVHWVLEGRVERSAAGLRTAATLHDARRPGVLLPLVVEAPDAAALGRALADSIRAASFTPGIVHSSL